MLHAAAFRIEDTKEYNEVTACRCRPDMVEEEQQKPLAHGSWTNRDMAVGALPEAIGAANKKVQGW